jgi:hypothetical protein
MPGALDHTLKVPTIGHESFLGTLSNSRWLERH